MEPMERLEDMSFEALLNIIPGSPEYEYIIDLECAHAGVSLLPDNPGPKPMAPDVQPDGALYKLGDWRFNDIAAAQEILECILKHGIWLDSSIGGVHVMERMDQSHYNWPDIKSTKAFTPAAFDKIKDELIKIEAEQADWREKNEAWESVAKERQSIIDKFNKKHDYVVEVQTGISKIKNNLTRYITLAQGSYPIAITFLKEADKQGNVFIEDEVVYYTCTSGIYHHVISREEHQKSSMTDLLTK